MNVDLDGWKAKLLRPSNSQGSVENGLWAYTNYARYLAEKQGVTQGDLAALGAYMDKLKSGEINVYRHLDNYVGWLTVERKLMPGTVAVWESLAVSFLRYHDIVVDSQTHNDKVTLPKNREIEDEPVKETEIEKLCLAATPYLRAFYLVLTSSGMRGGEAASLRIKDIDLETFKPIGLVSIRAVNTKTDTRRKTFISDEAVKSLQVIIEGRPTDELVFFNRANVTGNERQMMAGYHVYLLKKTGMDKKIEGHKFNNLHLHNLGRKFFFSRAIKPLGETATHALMGHGYYLKTYDRRPLEERAAEYKLAMQHFYIMQKTTTANKVQNAISTLKLLYPNEDLEGLVTEIAKSKGTQWRMLDEEKQYDVLKEAVAQSQGKVTVTRHGKVQYETTAIQRDDLDAAMALIADGWEQVAPINGSVVYRREKDA